MSDFGEIGQHSGQQYDGVPGLDEVSTLQALDQVPGHFELPLVTHVSEVLVLQNSFTLARTAPDVFADGHEETRVVTTFLQCIFIRL